MHFLDLPRVRLAPKPIDPLIGQTLIETIKDSLEISPSNLLKSPDPFAFSHSILMFLLEIDLLACVMPMQFEHVFLYQSGLLLKEGQAGLFAVGLKEIFGWGIDGLVEGF